MRFSLIEGRFTEYVRFFVIDHYPKVIVTDGNAVMSRGSPSSESR